MVDWYKLVSGSDIRGVAIGEDAILTNDVVKSISISFALFIEKTRGINISDQIIAVGHDSRLSGPRLKDVFVNALSSIGVQVYYCGLCSTPAMSMASNILSCSAAVEITASHHPKEFNGFKFFTSKGGLKSSDIVDIVETARTSFFPKSNIKGKVRNVDLMKKYKDSLKNMIVHNLGKNSPLSGTHIVVDASNGAGGFFVDILKKLGADTSGSSLLDPDGNFPSHVPNPENQKSIEFIKKLTLDSNADLGIIFDADVDRCFFVDDKGIPIVKSQLVALVSKFVLRDHPKSVIVTDSVTSDHLKKFIENNGGKQYRERRGYQNVIGTAKDLNYESKQCFLAIETSGHAAFEENDFKDDGAYLAVKMIIEMMNLKKQGKKLSEEVAKFKDSKESKEIRIYKENKEEIEGYLDNMKEKCSNIEGCSEDYDTPEGIRFNFSICDRNGWCFSEYRGWCLFRQSAHDLSIVLNVESDDDGGVEKILQNIQQ